MFNLLESLPEVLRPRLIGLFLRKSRCLGYFSKHSSSLLSSHIYSLGTSVSTVLHYYHLTLNFCQMNQVLGGYFFRVSLFGKYFISFFFSAGKYFFGVVQQYPTPLIPVCWYATSTLWVLKFLFIPGLNSFIFLFWGH